MKTLILTTVIVFLSLGLVAQVSVNTDGADPNGTYPASPDSAVVKGNLNYLDLNLTLSNPTAIPKSGWNLVGNPFSIVLNWNGDASWNLNNVGAANYIIDPVAGNYVVWKFYSGGGNIPVGG